MRATIVNRLAPGFAPQAFENMERAGESVCLTHGRRISSDVERPPRQCGGTAQPGIEFSCWIRSSPVYDYHTAPNNTCVTTAKARLLLEHALSAKGKRSRWFANQSMRTNLALNSQLRIGICNALRVTSNAGANSRMPQPRICNRSSFRRFEIGERTSGRTGDYRG